MTPVSDPSRSLWNARLCWVERSTPNARACAQWYARLLGDSLRQVAENVWQLDGPQRRLRFSVGAEKTVPRVAFVLPDVGQWSAYKTHLTNRQSPLKLLAAASDVGENAFEVTDPDGRSLVFCAPDLEVAAHLSAGPAADGAALPGRLQHFVSASTRTQEMLAFYRDGLGFIESDRVVDGAGDLSSAFLRSDAEHHSIAVFRAPHSGPDHHAYEVPNWNAIRDWADHCAQLDIPIWWGPGRHGVGNNLFFMIEDPDGYKVEFSAELERMTPEQPYREWPHGPKALNLWGSAWMRS